MRILLLSLLYICVIFIGIVAAARSSKYTERDPARLESFLFDSESTNEPFVSNCKYDISYMWTAEASGPVMSTPLIADLQGDGQKEILVGTWAQGVDVLGGDGLEVSGWPLLMSELRVQSSPLLYDIDRDGGSEIVITTMDGEVYFAAVNGSLTNRRLQIPKLRVKKDWYYGVEDLDLYLQLHDADTENAPDLRSPPLATTSEPKLTIHTERAPIDQAIVLDKRPTEIKAPKTFDEILTNAERSKTPLKDAESGERQELIDAIVKEHKQLIPEVPNEAENDEPPVTEEFDERIVVDAPVESESATVVGDENDALDDTRGEDTLPFDEPVADNVIESEVEYDERDHADIREDGTLVEHAKGRKLLAIRKTPKNVNTSNERKPVGGRVVSPIVTTDIRAPPRPTISMDDKRTAEALLSLNVFFDTNINEMMPPHHLMDDGFFQDEAIDHQNVYEDDPLYVGVDAHVLATPLIADLLGDGEDSLIVPVSYYFDPEQFDGVDHMREIPKDVDPRNFIAAGLVVFSLRTGKIQWSVNLDLTTSTPLYKAYMRATPSVADLDGDGKLEIVVGSTAGFLYAFNSTGGHLPNFPIIMGSVDGRVALSDINGDGKIEIVVTDALGNVIAFDSTGQEIWEKQIVGDGSASGVTIADVNGDGKMDVVVGTNIGIVWALEGTTGDFVADFPIVVSGPVRSSITPLRTTVSPNHMLVLITSTGVLHLIDGPSTCVIDIGDISQSSVLVDDIAGTGEQQLVVASSTGVVYLLSTPFRSHPLSSWTSESKSFGTQVLHAHGVHFVVDRPGLQEVAGAQMVVSFRIVDFTKEFMPYRITIRHGNNVLRTEHYTLPDKYTITIPSPNVQKRVTLIIEMENKFRQVYSDTMGVAFNEHFDKPLKWVIAAPFIATCLYILYTAFMSTTGLPM